MCNTSINTNIDFVISLSALEKEENIVFVTTLFINSNISEMVHKTLRKLTNSTT